MSSPVSVLKGSPASTPSKIVVADVSVVEQLLATTLRK
jgi:hypothetical protein